MQPFCTAYIKLVYHFDCMHIRVLTCIWRNIKKGIITINAPLRETRYNAVSNIYLPVPKTELFKKSVFFIMEPHYGIPYPLTLEFVIISMTLKIICTNNNLMFLYGTGNHSSYHLISVFILCVVLYVIIPGNVS